MFCSSFHRIGEGKASSETRRRLKGRRPDRLPRPGWRPGGESNPAAHRFLDESLGVGCRTIHVPARKAGL